MLSSAKMFHEKHFIKQLFAQTNIRSYEQTFVRINRCSYDQTTVREVEQMFVFPIFSRKKPKQVFGEQMFGSPRPSPSRRKTDVRFFVRHIRTLVFDYVNLEPARRKLHIIIFPLASYPHRIHILFFAQVWFLLLLFSIHRLLSIPHPHF